MNMLTEAAWSARLALLKEEKRLTRLRDEIAAERRALPKVPVTKSYIFTGPDGPAAFTDLFAGRTQLIVYHFMFGPKWQKPCKSCAFWAEHFDGIRVHLAERDVELAAVSRAPIGRIEAVRELFGWRFPWYSSLESDFNFDFGVSFIQDGSAGQPNYNFNTQSFGGEEAPGLSVFQKDDQGMIFYSYSTYARGLDSLNGTYQFLDLVPKGRDEDALDYPMAWVRLKKDM